MPAKYTKNAKSKSNKFRAFSRLFAGKKKPKMTLQANISIVEDRTEIRGALENLIVNTDGLSLAGSYATMEAALEFLPKNLPDVLLCDIGLPKMSGIEGVKILKKRFSATSGFNADRLR